MKNEINTTNDQGQARTIVMADEAHNQTVSLYDNDTEIFSANNSDEFLRDCPETLELSDSQLESVQNFDTGAE